MTRPELCIVGPLLGRNVGGVTTQGERLADLFVGAGYPVVAVSGARNPYRRVWEIVSTLLRRRRTIDVVVMQVFSGRSFVVEDVASWVATRLGLPIVMVLRGGNLPAFAKRHPAWVKRVIDRADVVVAPSEYLARAFRNVGFEVVVVPNVIDFKAYGPRQRAGVEPRLFWMRAFHPIYNPELAVRTLARVRESLPHATLTLGGSDRGSLASVRRLAADLGVSGAIHFAGFLDMPSKLREFDNADIYLNTNRIDNVPVSVIEAFAMGLPVVATRVGGIPDLIQDGRTGLMVADDDHEAMAEAVLRLVRDKALARELSLNGIALAATFDADTVLPRWEALVLAAYNRRTKAA